MANLSPAQEQTEPETSGKPKPKVPVHEGDRPSAAGEEASLDTGLGDTTDKPRVAPGKTERVRNTAPSGDWDDTFPDKPRKSVDAAKVALGERGLVWWTDGAPDFNRHKVSHSPYAEWWTATS